MCVFVYICLPALVFISQLHQPPAWFLCCLFIRVFVTGLCLPGPLLSLMLSAHTNCLSADVFCLGVAQKMKMKKKTLEPFPNCLNYHSIFCGWSTTVQSYLIMCLSYVLSCIVLSIIVVQSCLVSYSVSLLRHQVIAIVDSFVFLFLMVMVILPKIFLIFMLMPPQYLI